MVFTVALTGGIGSGKSTVASMFASLGIDVIDTDELSRAVVAPGTSALNSIIQHFGTDIIDQHQQLDRQQLRQRIFNHPKEKQWLEQLLHPLILQQLYERIKSSSSPYCIAVIPLLFEVTWDFKAQRTLVVDCTVEQQIQRASQRDECHQGDIKKIIHSQIARDLRLQRADDVIENSGSQIELEQQVKKLHEVYTSLATT